MIEPNVPTDTDWEGYELDSDSTWAHGIFFGKSDSELAEIFESNPVEAAENIFRIPEKALPYYFLKFGRYAKSAAHSDDISKSDAASAFLNYLLAISRRNPLSIKEVAPQLLEIGHFIAAHQEAYCADKEIYGDFLAVYEDSKNNLSCL